MLSKKAVAGVLLFWGLVAITSAVLSGMARADGGRADDAVIQSLVKVTPDTIKKARKALEENREAAAKAPKLSGAKSSVIAVSLEPGSPTPVLHLAHEYLTMLRVVDKSGAPWPIKHARAGSKGTLEVNVEGQNVLSLTPLAAYKATNVLMMLEGLDDGVMVVAQNDKPAGVLLDRITLVIDGMGPAARPAGISPFANLDTGDDMIAALNGLPPRKDAVQMQAAGLDGVMIWRSGGNLYLRVTGDQSLIFPAPVSQLTGVYKSRYEDVITLADGVGNVSSYTLEEVSHGG